MVAPQVMLPDFSRRGRRRRPSLGRFGLVPGNLQITVPGGRRRFPCPQLVEWIPPGCTSQIVTDPLTGCSSRVPICPPGGPQTPPALNTSPVPANFPTNQLYVAPDGSFWEYSQARGMWINTGTPYNVGAPIAAAPTTPTSAPSPVTVVSPPAPAPATSPYQSVIDFATGSTLISGIPNWLVGVGIYLGGKLLLEKATGKH